MPKKKTINTIIKEIPKVLNSQETTVALEAGALTVGLSNPVLGASFSAVNLFRKSYDKFKLQQFVLGLSSGLNIEMHLNELYNYIKSSPERAFAVGNVLQETLAAHSQKICILYGIILADHKSEPTSDFSIDDIIVIQALASASDFDLVNFKEIMENYINTDGMIEYPKVKQEDLEKTCLWCVYSRLFNIHNHTWATLAPSEDEEKKTIKTNYVTNSSSKLLLKYINQMHQTWRYR